MLFLFLLFIIFVRINKIETKKMFSNKNFLKDKLTKTNLKQKLEATKNDLKAVSSSFATKFSQATEMSPGIKQKLEETKNDLSNSLTKKLNQITESPNQKQR